MNTEQQVIIHSPTQENQQALSSRIEETVQMSTYQIKKALEAERINAVDKYKALGDQQNTQRNELHNINIRLTNAMKEKLMADAIKILELIQPYIGYGGEYSYFDDNRTTDPSLEEIAAAIIIIDHDIDYNRQPAINKNHVYVFGSINLFGSKTDAWDFEGKQCVFYPERRCEKFELTPEEKAQINHRNNLEEQKTALNKRVNEIDIQLKNIGALTEDIRYAMLVEKNNQQGDTTAMDIATKIAQAYIQGIDPSIALLSN